MKRVAVVTSASGNGGTTFGRVLAARLQVPFVELDALNYGPGWAQATPEQLRARVAPLVATDAWVIEGGYWGKLGDLVLDRTDLVVWLDLPTTVWLPRLVRRTIRRIVRKEELWHGNRETFRGGLVGRDALLVYMLRNYRRRRRVYPERLRAYNTVRLRTTGEVERFLRSVAPVT